MEIQLVVILETYRTTELLGFHSKIKKQEISGRIHLC